MELQTPPKFDESIWQQLELARIFEVLENGLITPFGKEKLFQMEPSIERETVEHQLKEVEEYVGLLTAGYPPPLSGMTDFRPFLAKIKPENAFLEAEELLELKSNLQIMGEIGRFFKLHAQEAPLLAQIARGIHYHRTLIKEIESTIDGSGEVRDDASPELRQIRLKIRSLEAELKKGLQQALKKYAEYTQEDIITLRDGRMVLGIQQQWVNKVNGVVHGTSASGATVFVEPMETLHISNRIQSLRVEERLEIIRILQFLTGLVKEIRHDLEYGLENVAYLDLVQTKARLAMALQAHKPRLTREPRLKLLQARHPLLILKMGHQNVVPLSLEMGQDFTTLVITGPNAGGKTVALKTIGLLLVMVQLGLLLPVAPDSTVPLLKNILVDIGDRQSLEQDLSTFSSHIIRLRDILQQADRQSLVLVDEIGTGTDPREGAALAIAILTHLTEKKVLTVATTHHGELKAFAHTQEGVQNASMEFDLETLQPTYHMRVGVPGSSYAFEIARRYGMPEFILKTAQEILGREKDRLESLILDLEKQLQALEKERRELNVKLTEAEALRKLYSERLTELERKKKELQLQAAEEARQILQRSKATIERAIADIRRSQAERESIRAAKEAVTQQEREVEALLKELAPERRVDLSLKKGDKVWIEHLRETGELLSDPDEKGRVRVLVGDVKMELDAANLQKVVGEGEERVRISRHLQAEQLDAMDEGIPPEIDLRGMDAQQAIEETDRYLDQALSAGWDEVRIIHGKGSGILRREVNRFLSRDPRVAEKRLGRWGEGDTGVTVVRLKKEESAQPE